MWTQSLHLQVRHCISHRRNLRREPLFRLQFQMRQDEFKQSTMVAACQSYSTVFNFDAQLMNDFELNYK